MIQSRIICDDCDIVGRLSWPPDAPWPDRDQLHDDGWLVNVQKACRPHSEDYCPECRRQRREERTRSLLQGRRRRREERTP